MRCRTSITAKTATIGLKIRLARLRSGLTQTALAEQIRSRAGSKSAYKPTTLEQLISRLERGERITYPDRLIGSLTEILGPLDAEEPIDINRHFPRPVAIDISRDGTITYRRWGTPPLRGGFPIFSVSCEEEARRLQIHLCHKLLLPDPRLPGEPWFAFIKFTKAILLDGRDFGDLLGPTILEFAKAYEQLRSSGSFEAASPPQQQFR
ncbi:MAG TPA: helix-turn-helix transcriptional regulator [Xanthobacteraceae bacterium]|jgi:transcriptional regulator with XRE-family HTH domain